MKEILVINWSLISGSLLLIVGLGMVLSYLSLFHIKKFGAVKFGKYLVALGGIMAAFGLLVLFLWVDNSELASVKLPEPVPNPLKFGPGFSKIGEEQLKIINRFKVDEKGLNVFIHKGRIETPLIKFQGNGLKFMFSAKGSFCKGEYTTIKFVYEELKKNNVFEILLKRFLVLENSLKEYEMKVENVKGKKGRFRIIFVNDDFDPLKKQDRNLWIGNFGLLVE